jgi:hypothetical protein
VPLLAPTGRSSSRASRPERRAARGPSTESGAPALPVQHQEIVTESNEPSRVNCTGRQPGSRVRAHGKLCGRCRGGDMPTPQKRPSTGHYLRATSDNRLTARVTVLRLITGRGHLIRLICARCRPDLADERTTVPVDTAGGGQVARLAHLLRLNPPDGRSSHIEWQPEGHRRL